LNKKPFLTGSKVILSKVNKEDHKTFFEIEDVMENRLLMDDGIPFPPREEGHISFLENISADKDEYTFAIRTLEDEIFIGTIGVFRINWKNSTCYVGISIHKDYQKQGYGSDAMKVLVNFIFEFININKIKLEVFSFNPVAIRSYEKCGFKTEGVLRSEVFRFGTFHDLHVMGILRSDWLDCPPDEG
jgi:[ribosomal protein S5]-alanine N-acetyltransferase